ncbi:voltage-dependent anion channel [Lanmaoa asiatica]|nr:voltage-dependent anion channel [Lanmaoa asiatica]KAH0827741.1 voltage-dependent anion channel [Lanmaoa asiatica]
MSSKKAWNECIRHFTPAWHTVIMGTGATSALIHNFPYGHGSPLIRIFTLIIFFLNLVLFTFISVATAARYALFPDIWSKMLRHPAQSLFVGAVPMGFATLINIALDMNQETGFGGLGFLYFLWGCWWIDSIVSFLCAFGMVYAMSNVQAHSFSKMAAVWLLPVVTLIVASSTGGLLSTALHPQSLTLALLTTGISFTMVTIGLTLAMMMITVYLARLIVYGPPDANLILSAFVVLGPLGQGGYSLLVNGANIAALLPVHNSGEFPMSSVSGQLLYSFCFCMSYILWSMGICWIFIAILSIFSVLKQSGTPCFGLAYWGLIFPNGVFALLSVQLGNVLDSGFFRAFGALWSCVVFLLWITISIRTVPALIDRSIFNAPCLAAAPASPPKSDVEEGSPK